MCGIVGLFLKTERLVPSLGALVAEMLVEMTDRGPDSAGIAVYRNPTSATQAKLTLRGPFGTDWAGLASEMTVALNGCCEAVPVADHAVVTIPDSTDSARAWLAQAHPAIAVVGQGRTIEVYKDVGLTQEVADRIGLQAMAGTHAIGHTRMATESAVTPAGSHPFVAGDDLCLVHNGSLSIYYDLRRILRRRGMGFETENDSEVAAKYLAWQLRQGLSLEQALKAGKADLDGFYTFCVGTADGFAVARDGIGCKPATMAETEDWVAMASEYRAMAHLPGADTARVWEPEPGGVYAWTRGRAALAGAA